MIDYSIYRIYNAIINRFEVRKKKFYVKYNRWLFHRYGYPFGEGMRILNRIYIKGNGTITVGNNFLYLSGDSLNPLCKNIRGSFHTCNKGKIIIGDYVGISSACIWAQDEIRIGNHVKIGGNCLIIDTDSHPIDYITRRTREDDEVVNSSPISIEDDVWIGANSIVLKGVTIGARSIIGAGSVVTTSIPADCIAAGNPCKVIKLLK